MQLIPNISLQKKLERTARYLVFIVIGISIIVLFGWQFNVEIMKRMIPGLVAMNPLTAVGFLLVSAAFLLKQEGALKQQKTALATLFALVVIIAGAVKFIDFIYDFNLKPDLLLFGEKVRNTLVNGKPNYMAPNTAVCLVLSGLAILLLNVEVRSKYIPVQLVALCIAFAGLLSILGYIYKVEAFYKIPLFVPMAFHTALCFFLIALGMLFANPGRGMMKEFTSVYTGSITAQRLLPAAVIVPAALGFLRLYGDWAGLYTKEFGVAIFALAIILAFLVLIWYNSILLNRRDALSKQTEDALQQTRSENEYLANLVDKSNDGIVSFDESFVILSWNKGAEKIYGYTLEEVRGKYSGDVLKSGYNNERLDEWISQLKRDGQWTGELKQVHKNGAEVNCLLSTSVLKDDKGNITGFLTITKDITDRKREEEKLRKSEERFRLLVNNVRDYAIFMLDQEGRIISWNNGATHIHGYTEDEIIGKNIEIFYTQEDRANKEPAANLAMAKENGSYEMEGVRIRKDGTRFLANVVFTVLLNDDGSLRGYSKITRNITKRKQLENDLRKSNAEMEAFTYSVSHDLRAPLRSIIGFTKILEDDYTAQLDEEAKRIMGIITNNTIKMGMLIDDLLNFSRMSKQDIIKTDFDTHEMLKGIIADQGNRNGKPIQWTVGQLPRMYADINSVKQVWINLLSNAVKYSSGKNDPHIWIDAENKGGYLIFSVKDNGVGFDEKYSNKLFKVFQRLHSSNEFEGTGVGLAIVEKIVSKHGGEVWAKAIPGEGATFYFSIPEKPVGVN